MSKSGISVILSSDNNIACSFCICLFLHYKYTKNIAMSFSFKQLFYIQLTLNMLIYLNHIEIIPLTVPNLSGKHLQDGKY